MSTGREFQGVGALSAGASSRLLINYPEEERNEILDYLFTPNYGASLQLLNVEVGGDTNSTSGAEPSHSRTPDDLDCNRGYEWWLMEEAKKRNPNIKIAAREWGAPRWVDNGEDEVWSQDNIEYYLSWLKCAERHGLKVDYLGGWNESGYDVQWYVNLANALRKNGYEDVKIVADDSFSWKIVEAMRKHEDLFNAVDIVGQHYVCGHLTPARNCPSPEAARNLEGKPLWHSEGGSLVYDDGAKALARSLNRMYTDGKMTGMVNWSVTASWYTSLPYAGTGLLRAYEPWSGYYEVGESIWVMAHTTQFTEPGWRYLDSASGYLGDKDVSYVTLRSPTGGDYSTVIETMDAEKARTQTFRVGRGLSKKRVHVWTTDLNSNDPDDWFVETSVKPRGGKFSVTLEPGRVYTLTTTTGQSKGDAEPPRQEPFRLPMPYEEDFEEFETPAAGSSLGRSPRLFSDINGAFQTARCTDRDGRCLRQVITEKPIPWIYGSPTEPMTLVGDPMWQGDYEVIVDARIGAADHVEVLGRVGAQDQTSGAAAGYHFRIYRDGRWTLFVENFSDEEKQLASGRLTSFDPAAWHELSLSFEDNKITASVDGKTLAGVTDGTHNRGQAGLLVSAWDSAEFDNLGVKRTGPGSELIPQARMSAESTSYQPFSSTSLAVLPLTYGADNAIDNNPATIWRTKSNKQLPQSITLDLGRAYEVSRLRYTPTYDPGHDGAITEYTISVSADGEHFEKVGSGSWKTDATTKTAGINTDEVRYVRLTASASHGDYAAAAEITISGNPT